MEQRRRTGSSGKKRTERPARSFSAVRWAVCLGLLVLCGAYKLFFPASAAQFGEKLCRIIDTDGKYVAVLEELGQDIAQSEDIRAAFGAVTDVVFPSRG